MLSEFQLKNSNTSNPIDFSKGEDILSFENYCGNIARETFYQSEVKVIGLTEDKGKTICQLKLNLSRSPELSQHTIEYLKLTSTEEDIKKFLTSKVQSFFIQFIEQCTNEIKLRKLADVVQIIDLDLSRNQISGRAILFCERKDNGENWDKKSFKRFEKNVQQSLQILSMNQTLISSSGLAFLYKLKNLRELYLDKCKEIKTIQNPEKTACASIRKISLVGTPCEIEENALEKIEAKFPGIEEIDFTQRSLHDREIKKLLGVYDIVTLRTIQNPVVMNCGHMLGMETYAAINHKCPSCRKLQNKKPIWFPASRFEKKEGVWKIKIVDYARSALSDRVYYHACGQLFNEETLEAFKHKWTPNYFTFPCPDCEEPLYNLDRIYVQETPDTVNEDSMNQRTLSSVEIYRNEVPNNIF